ncbi:hypothetical protein EVAR_60368_1, partial [Eumeta japonica]
EFILHELHEGHLDVARSCVYWPGLEIEIEAVCRTCEPGRQQRHTSSRAPLAVPGASVAVAAYRLHAAEYRCKHYLVVVDAHPKSRCRRWSTDPKCTRHTGQAAGACSWHATRRVPTDAEFARDDNIAQPKDINEALDTVASSGVQSEREAAHESCEVHSRIPVPAIKALVEAKAPKEVTKKRALGSPDTSAALTTVGPPIDDGGLSWAPDKRYNRRRQYSLSYDPTGQCPLRHDFRVRAKGSCPYLRPQGCR